MFGTHRSPASIYAQVSIESDVKSADPHRLVMLLFEGAQTAILMARMHMEQKNIPQKGEAISKAIDIVTNGLLASLDIKGGGLLAERLAALYEYISHRLLWANLKNDLAALDEVASLLGELQSAWAMIDPSAQSPAGDAKKDAA